MDTQSFPSESPTQAHNLLVEALALLDLAVPQSPTGQEDWWVRLGRLKLRAKEKITVVELPPMVALTLRNFLEASLSEMKGQASAVEWDSPEIQVVRGCLEVLIRQLPKEIL